MELLRLLEKASDNEKYKEQYKSDKKRFGSLSEVEEDPFALDNEEDAVEDEPEETEVDKETPEKDQEPQSEPILTPSYETVKVAINNLRAGHSLKDDETEENLRVYYDSLDEEEKLVLQTFLEEVGKILNLSITGDKAQVPDEPPVNIDMISDEEKADKEAEAGVKSDETEEDEGDPFAMSDEDTSPPISVKENYSRYSESAFRQKIKELITK